MGDWQCSPITWGKYYDFLTFISRPSQAHLVTYFLLKHFHWHFLFKFEHGHLGSSRQKIGLSSKDVVAEWLTLLCPSYTTQWTLFNGNKTWGLQTGMENSAILYSTSEIFKHQILSVSNMKRKKCNPACARLAMWESTLLPQTSSQAQG